MCTKSSETIRLKSQITKATIGPAPIRRKTRPIGKPINNERPKVKIAATMLIRMIIIPIMAAAAPKNRRNNPRRMPRMKIVPITG
jgi:hypothetical protein